MYYDVTNSASLNLLLWRPDVTYNLCYDVTNPPYYDVTNPRYYDVTTPTTMTLLTLLLRRP